MNNKNSGSFGKLLADNSAFVGLLIIILIGIAINMDAFFTLNNFANVGRQSAIRGLMACGMTLVIISGSIDLSVSTSFAFCSYLALYFSQYSAALAFLVPLGVGVVLGIINTILICRMRIPAMVATISTQMGVQGILLMLTRGDTFKPKQVNTALQAFGRFSLGEYLNTYLIVFAVIFIVIGFLMKNIASFRNIYAVGSNEEAARLMGVNVFNTMLLAHIICGMLAALAGILLAARTQAAYPLAGTSYEMYAIAAAVLGGTYLTGGRGRLLGTFVGAWILGFLSNIFNMQKMLNPLWEQVITGLILLIVVFFQSLNSMGFFAGKRAKVQQPAKA
jgi:Ribose/xylose/arabinose/galactoside ABC-type transport systems, permease components